MTLCVLSLDNLIRQFELSLSYDEPDHIVELGGGQIPRRKKGYNADMGQFTPVGLTFGHHVPNFSAATLFVLMENGDIYLICPVLPRMCRVSRTDLEMFVVQVEHSADVLAQKQLSNQSPLLQRWLKQILLQLEASMLETDRDLGIDMITFTRPKAFHFDPQPQGPLLFNRTSINHAQANVEHSFSDLSVVTVASLVAIATIEFGGNLEMNLLVGDIIPSWTIPSSKENCLLPTVRTFESVKLDSSDLAQPYFFTADVAYPYKFWAYSHSSIFEITTLTWLRDEVDSFGMSQLSLSEDYEELRTKAPNTVVEKCFLDLSESYVIHLFDRSF